MGRGEFVCKLGIHCLQNQIVRCSTGFIWIVSISFYVVVVVVGR